MIEKLNKFLQTDNINQITLYNTKSVAILTRKPLIFETESSAMLLHRPAKINKPYCLSRAFSQLVSREGTFDVSQQLICCYNAVGETGAKSNRGKL